jgi:hypothetical protein
VYDTLYILFAACPFSLGSLYLICHICYMSLFQISESLPHEDTTSVEESESKLLESDSGVGGGGAGDGGGGGARVVRVVGAPPPCWAAD